MVADQLGETVSFTREEAEMIIGQVLEREYQVVEPERLTTEERFRLASALHKKYALSVDQLVSGLHLPAGMLAQALRSKQYK